MEAMIAFMNILSSNVEAIFYSHHHRRILLCNRWYNR